MRPSGAKYASAFSPPYVSCRMFLKCDSPAAGSRIVTCCPTAPDARTAVASAAAVIEERDIRNYSGSGWARRLLILWRGGAARRFGRLGLRNAEQLLLCLALVHHVDGLAEWRIDAELAALRSGVAHRETRHVVIE